MLSEFVDGVLGLLTGGAFSPVLDAGTVIAIVGAGASRSAIGTPTVSSIDSSPR